MNKKSYILFLFLLSVVMTILISEPTHAVFEFDRPPDGGGNGSQTEYYYIYTGVDLLMSEASFSNADNLGYNQNPRVYEVFAKVSNEKSYIYLDECEELYIKTKYTYDYTYNRFYEIEGYASSYSEITNNGMWLIEDTYLGLKLYTKDDFSSFENSWTTNITDSTYLFHIFNNDKKRMVSSAEFNNNVTYNFGYTNSTYNMYAYYLIYSDDLRDGIFFMNGQYDEQFGFPDYAFINGNSNFSVTGDVIFQPSNTTQFVSIEFYTFSNIEFDNVVAYGENVQYIPGIYIIEV